ncbi:hypothetical protein, partial [Bifidobacterium longum]|uniref:hypothetical protein n=1 Tax=Bifidobacterium longum TaxID=216816 RepID=UPI00249E174C
PTTKVLDFNALPTSNAIVRLVSFYFYSAEDGVVFRHTTQVIPLSEWKRNTYRIHILLRILHILLCILPTARHPAAVTRKSYPPPDKKLSWRVPAIVATPG